MVQYVYGENPYADILQRVYNINKSAVQTHLPSAFSDLTISASRQFPKAFDQLPLFTQMPSTSSMNRSDYGGDIVNDVFTVDILCFVDHWYANSGPDDAQYNAEAIMHAVKHAYYSRPRLELEVSGEDYVLPYLLNRTTLNNRVDIADFSNGIAQLRWTLQVPFEDRIQYQLKDN